MNDPFSEFGGHIISQPAPQQPQAQQTSDDPFAEFGGKSLQSPSQSDVAKALNYHTGNKLIDAPLGVVQGAGKGIMSSALGALDVIGKSTGNDKQYVTPEEREALTKPNGIGQGTGKFLEQTAEWMLPEAGANRLLEGGGLAARIAGKAGVGAGVSAIQSGGNPYAIGTGALLGGAGEAVGPLLNKFKTLSKAPVTPQNFSRAFEATTNQNKIISKAFDTLKEDGQKVPASLADAHAMVKNKLEELGQAYANLPADYEAKTMPVKDVIDRLKDVQKGFENNGKINPHFKESWSTVKEVIDHLEDLGKDSNGNISFKTLRNLRDGANSKTAWNSKEGNKDLYKQLGNTYREMMSDLVPETKELNQRYAVYNELANLADENVAKMKGTDQSGLNKVADKVVSRLTHGAVGALVGHATGVPGAEAALALIGEHYGPKLTAPAVEALSNFATNAGFKTIPQAAKDRLSALAQAGDSNGVIQFVNSMTRAATTRYIPTQAAAALSGDKKQK